MKKDMLNELTGLDSETVNRIAENAPELDKSSQERILKKCMEKDGSADAIVVSGTEHYKGRSYRNFAAAAAAVVLIGGIGGAFALGRKINRNAPSDSVNALVTTDEDIKEVDPASVPDGEGVQSGTEENTVAPDCTEPANVQEYTVPENSNDEEYEKWLNTIPEEYRDVVRNLKPGEVIHLPCIPVSEIPTDSGEPATSPPQTTTLPPETTVPPQTTTSPSDTTVPVQTTTEPADKKTPDMYNPMTNQAVIQPIDGYWISDWCGSSYWYFDSQKHCGTYYNSNTCSGFAFEYYYYTNDSHIELTVLDREIGYSGELWGTGNVVWITDDNFYIEWKQESPIIRQGENFECFTRNTSGSMPE